MFECIICNHTGKPEIIETFDTYTILGCPKCKFGIVDPIPSQGELDKLYNSLEYYTANMFYNFDTITEAQIAKQIEVCRHTHEQYIKKHIKPGQQMLEVGCGGGFTLKLFKDWGLEVMGVETSSISQAFAQKTFGVEVVNTPLEEFNTDKKFDIILLNHVLEHFVEPNIAMVKLKSLLKPGGILYVRVPDIDSYDRIAFGKKWPAYAHYHISNFSAKSLRVIYEKHGLNVVEIRKYYSQKIPKLLRLLMTKSPLHRFLVRHLNGRTITIIGKNK